MQSKKNSESKAITIYDIAREAGVSPSTVSRVLTSRAKVSSGKRDGGCKEPLLCIYVCFM